ncbi:MAG: Flp pilus assembly complex ATPase component TadA, partial [Dehalococcoidales bacterium]|nr:Flp pilus assembly complex ATPase component TadA [Dehalococcoidales bacterium]
MDIFELLRLAKEKGASDLHLVVSSPVLVRINGDLEQVNGIEPLMVSDINEAFLQITTPEEREMFHKQMELDFGYSIAGVGHFRCNAAQQRGAISLAVRLLPPNIPTIAELGLPPIFEQLIMKQRGLILVTGPTGSGKT